MITGYLTLFHASIGLRPKISTRSLGERSSGGSPGTSHRSIPCRHKTAPATSHRAALSRTPPSPFPTTPARLRGPCPARSRHGILPLGRHRRGNSRSLRQGAGGFLEVGFGTGVLPFPSYHTSALQVGGLYGVKRSPARYCSRLPCGTPLLPHRHRSRRRSVRLYAAGKGPTGNPPRRRRP